MSAKIGVLLDGRIRIEIRLVLKSDKIEAHPETPVKVKLLLVLATL